MLQYSKTILLGQSLRPLEWQTTVFPWLTVPKLHYNKHKFAVVVNAIIHTFMHSHTTSQTLASHGKMDQWSDGDRVMKKDNQLLSYERARGKMVRVAMSHVSWLTFAWKLEIKSVNPFGIYSPFFDRSLPLWKPPFSGFSQHKLIYTHAS